MVDDRLSGYTEVSLFKIQFLGIVQRICLPNTLNGWLRRRIFYVTSYFGVLGESTQVILLQISVMAVVRASSVDV
jgi:hypothetical protein